MGMLTDPIVVSGGLSREGGSRTGRRPTDLLKPRPGPAGSIASRRREQQQGRGPIAEAREHVSQE